MRAMSHRIKDMRMKRIIAQMSAPIMGKGIFQ
jgi:hypothetical protein